MKTILMILGKETNELAKGAYNFCLRKDVAAFRCCRTIRAGSAQPMGRG